MIARVLSTPVLSFLFAAGGAGIAWLVFNDLLLLAIAILGLLLIAGFILGEWGRVSLPKHPVRAVHLMDGQILAIASLTATAAALAIILGVYFVAPEATDTDLDAVAQSKSELKEVIAAVSAALAAFVTALATKAEDVDTAIGSRVRAMFYAAYPGENAAANAPPAITGAVTLPTNSAAVLAVYDNYAIPDWSRTNRVLRAKKLQEDLTTRNLIP